MRPFLERMSTLNGKESGIPSMKTRKNQRHNGRNKWKGFKYFGATETDVTNEKEKKRELQEGKKEGWN